MPFSNPPEQRGRPAPCRAVALLQHRFLKFGLVGGSGVLVNLAVLYLCQEHLLAGIASFSLRLKTSLLIAIFLATVNNFCWNRLWTWGDRPRCREDALLRQFGQYLLGTGLASAIQFFLTWALAAYIHYLAANLSAIMLAALSNYLLGDVWVFAREKEQRKT